MCLNPRPNSNKQVTVIDYLGFGFAVSVSCNWKLSILFPPAEMLTMCDSLCAYTDLINVFEIFLPQLLLYPNPNHGLNGQAAALMRRDRKHFEQKVKGT